MKYFYLTLSMFLLFLCNPAKTQEQEKPYKDLTHFSSVFGHDKYYRIYLPDGYGSKDHRYPVIYFFHGWGGRHFKDDNARLEYEKIGDLVDKYRLILVMWDGNIEESEPRPYNIGNHKDIRYTIQMKDYFPELVSYIDSEYRTINDRNHRGIIGFSMGGIMSFFLAGKYPHKVCADVNLAGSPEFFFGYPGNHTLYPLRYTFKNLMHVDTRQHNGDTDILVYLNEEVKKGALWEGNPYEYYGFKGGHMVDKPGETTAFEMAMKFVAGKFNENKFYPDRWSHYDVYDDFDVWDYYVESNKNVPGMLFLSDVSRNGLGFYTHRWLPDGPPVDSIIADITTAPLYTPGKSYTVVSYGVRDTTVTTTKLIADRNGCLSLRTNGCGMEYGIYDETGQPDFVVAKHRFNDSERMLNTRKPGLINIQIFNRGRETDPGQMLKIKLRTSDSTVNIPTSEVQITLNPEQRLVRLPALEISCNRQPPAHGEPFQVKLFVDITINDTTFTDEVILPLIFDVPAFNEISVDDGVKRRERVFGTGNGDEIANAGERVLLYNGDHRLRLYSNDPWVDCSQEQLIDEQIPAVWEDGFTMSSIVKIKNDCPDGHIIEFTGYYETNTWNPIERNLHWGKVFLKVRN